MSKAQALVRRLCCDCAFRTDCDMCTFHSVDKVTGKAQVDKITKCRTMRSNESVYGCGIGGRWFLKRRVRRTRRTKEFPSG